MAASSHGNYPVQAATPLVIDESSTAAADNTMHQMLNQSQLTVSQDGTPVGMIMFDNNNATGPSSVGGHYQPT